MKKILSILLLSISFLTFSDNIQNAKDVAYYNNLAYSYMLGEGVPQDAKKAKELLEKAISLDDDTYAEVYGNLGVLYSHGAEGVPQDVKKAKELLEKAISLDDKYAEAYYTLGTVYLVGGEGVSKDAKKAKELYEKAASVRQ